MRTVLLVVQVLAACGLIALVLLQHGRGADAGAAFGSGASGTLFGSRGPASFLSRSTAVLAAVFFLNSLALSYLAAHSVERSSVFEQLREEEQSAPRLAPESSDVPKQPTSSTGRVPQPAGTADTEHSDVPQVP